MYRRQNSLVNDILCNASITSCIEVCAQSATSRTTEAEQWAGRANAYYGGAAGLNALPLQGVFGDLDALKQGGGKSGSGAILNLTLRRALPMVVARKD